MKRDEKEGREGASEGEGGGQRDDDSRDQGGCGANQRRGELFLDYTQSTALKDMIATTAMGHLPLVWSRRWHTGPDSWRCIGLLNKAEGTSGCAKPLFNQNQFLHGLARERAALNLSMAHQSLPPGGLYPYTITRHEGAYSHPNIMLTHISDKDAICRRTRQFGHGEIENLFSVSLYPSIGNEDADAWHVQVPKALITPNHRPSVAHSHPTNGWTQDGV
ncbi:hypothetical protein BJ165DRAFT_1595649 [Panaeolus papilionaceus]|nr:hypothetical protein BJ165DRAFT_1595649 [Panaeolus papilionaceus]